MSYANGNEWLTVEQVAQRFAVSAATIWRWTRESKFPRPIKVGGRSTRWRRADIEQHEQALTESAASITPA